EVAAQSGANLRFRRPGTSCASVLPSRGVVAFGSGPLFTCCSAMKICVPSLLAAVFLCGTSMAATKVGFIEEFALSPDRERVLTQLVPGSEDYYFYHALHFQNTKQQEMLAEILKQWAARFPDSEQ